MKKPLHKLIIRNHLKILVVSTGLVFGKKPVLLGLFLEELIIERVNRNDVWVISKR